MARLGIIIMACLLSAKIGSGQQLSQKERLIEEFDTSSIKGNQLLLRTPYDKPQILNKKLLDKFKKLEFIRIELFYTKFQRSEKFNQAKLNQARWKELEKLLPGVTQNEAVAYYETGQTKVESLEKGRKMFHGFLINYRLGVDSAAYQNELAKLKAFLDLIGEPSKTGTTSLPKTTPKKQHSLPGKTIKTQFKGGEPALKEFLLNELKFKEGFMRSKCFGTVNVRFIIDTLGKVKFSKIATGLGSPCDELALMAIDAMPPWIAGKLDGKPTETNYMLPIKFFPDRKGAIPGDLIINNTYVPHSGSILGGSGPPPVGFEKLDESAENVVFSTLTKNTYKNAVLVIDVTASMAPYLAQTMKWLSKNINKGIFKKVYFFNDGDGKNERFKTIGSTGGIYSTYCKSIDAVKETLLKACNSGGDLAENNIEALIKAQNENPDCEQLVMIADNMATPRDMALLPEVKLPVHSILCGSRFAANGNYLEIAKATGGSVNIMNGQTPDLTHLKDGEEFKLGLFTFKYTDGKFQKTFK